MPMPGDSWKSPIPHDYSDRTTTNNTQWGPGNGFEETKLRVLEEPVLVPANVAADIRHARAEEQAARTAFDLPKKLGLRDIPPGATPNINQEQIEREMLIKADQERRRTDEAARRRDYEQALELWKATEYAGHWPR
jgi:hypothetical protein